VLASADAHTDAALVDARVEQTDTQVDASGPEDDAAVAVLEPDAAAAEAGGAPVARGNGCACDTAGRGGAVSALWPVALLARLRRRRRVRLRA
jgi:uncharacterized protein (TIGR03382 family)